MKYELVSYYMILCLCIMVLINYYNINKHLKEHQEVLKSNKEKIK